MSSRSAARGRDWTGQFPPSEPCACEICLNYCRRPGWWTVAEASSALEAGYGGRMMLEPAPDRSFGVLAPAFRGNEGFVALQQFAGRWCGFLEAGRCGLHGTGYQPLECRFCHHARVGQGTACHAALEADWAAPAGRALVIRWCRANGLWERLPALGLALLKRREHPAASAR